MATIRDWIAGESAKRLRNWDRAEQQANVRRNTPAVCLREQQRKLAQMRAYQANRALGIDTKPSQHFHGDTG